MLPPAMDTAKGTLTVQWLAPSGSFDGFAVEARYGAGAYQQLGSTLPASTLTYSFTPPAALEEAADCTLRAKAIRGGDSSPYSNEVTYHNPLLGTGQPSAVYNWALGGTNLSWSSSSLKADAYVVKRAECSNAGTLIGTWANLGTVTSTTKTYLDTSAKLGTYYTYTITNSKGSETSAESQPSAVVSTQIPAPTSLVAVYDLAHAGVSLTWGSSFTYGDGVLLERAAADSNGNAIGAWTALSGLTAGSSAFLDSQVQEASNYVYRISNVRSLVGSAAVRTSAAVTVPAGTPSGLQATISINQGVPVLTWTANSTRATAVQVERAEADNSGLPSKPWVTLPVPTGAITSFTDLTAQEFSRYVYRVSNGFGASWGAASAISPSVATPLAAPSQVAAAFDAAANSAKVTWVANTTKADYVLVERAPVDANGLPSGIWSTLTSYGSTTGHTDTGLTELTAYRYRVSNLAGGVPSAASAPSAPLRTPLAKPSNLWTYSNSNGSVNVNWSSSYGNDRTYLLARADSDSTGTPISAWSPLSVPTGYQFSFQDSTVAEGRYYVYRLAIALNGYTTPFQQTANAIQTALNPPVQLVATPRPARVDLAWVNKSAAATQVVIRRSFSNSVSKDVATLSPGTTSYSDANLALGTYSYAVVAKAASQEAANSSVTATTQNAGDSLTLTATPLNVASATDAALKPAGSWAFANYSPFGILSNPGDAWAGYYPDTSSRLSSALVQVDGAGHPHSVYLIPSTTTPTHSIVCHLWHDGTAWKTEDLWEGDVVNTYGTLNLSYRLESTGRPQVVLSTNSSYNPTVGSLRHIHFTAGAWQSDSLAGVSNAALSFNAFSLSLDPADQTHLLCLIGTNAVEFLPNGAGGWTSATISAEPLSVTASPFLQAAWTDAANGWLFYTTSTSTYPYQVSLKATQKLAGTWQAPVTLTSSETNSYGDPVLSICANTARTRVVAGFATAVGLKVYHLATGTWHETLIPTPSPSVSWYHMGMDASDHLHVLVVTPGSGISHTDFHE